MLQLCNAFFLKQGQKICPNLLLDKKRIAQLINGKPGENRYNKIMRETKPDAMHFDMVHVRATLGNPAYPPKPHKNRSYAVLDENKGRTRSCVSARPAKNFEGVTKFGNSPSQPAVSAAKPSTTPICARALARRKSQRGLFLPPRRCLRRSPPPPTLASPHPS
jgi:hypothetical protein